MRTQKRSKEVGDRPWKCEPSETRRRGEGLARDWCWTARSKRMARAPAHGNTIRSAYASVMTRTRECAVADEEGMHMCRSAASVSCTRRACGAVRVPPPHASTACGFVLEDARLPARTSEGGRSRTCRRRTRSNMQDEDASDGRCRWTRKRHALARPALGPHSARPALRQRHCEVCSHQSSLPWAVHGRRMATFFPDSSIRSVL